ncbi:MAG: rhodanese-like domain-containing protein [archaeon]|nr:rhodanese-like domain-containing protein [archaeon]
MSKDDSSLSEDANDSFTSSLSRSSSNDLPNAPVTPVTRLSFDVETLTIGEPHRGQPRMAPRSSRTGHSRSGPSTSSSYSSSSTGSLSSLDSSPSPVDIQEPSPILPGLPPVSSRRRRTIDDACDGRVLNSETSFRSSSKRRLRQLDFSNCTSRSVSPRCKLDSPRSGDSCDSDDSFKVSKSATMASFQRVPPHPEVRIPRSRTHMGFTNPCESFFLNSMSFSTSHLPSLAPSDSSSPAPDSPHAGELDFPRLGDLEPSELPPVNRHSTIQRAASDISLGEYSQISGLLPSTRKVPGAPNITAETLCRVMKGEFSDSVKHLTIIDCRFPFEYQDGHIHGSVNQYLWEDIVKNFTRDPLVLPSSVFIFHCEFSQHRAPTLGNALRNWDRRVSIFPTLHYPEVYILEGGYVNFFAKYPGLCTPQAYTPMLHDDHKDELKQCLKRLKFSQRKLKRENESPPPSGF